MENNLLEKYKNDPAWAEVIRLYSGLFDTQDERESFILDLAETNILLAAECKTSSMEEEKTLKLNILDKLNFRNNTMNEVEDQIIVLIEFGDAYSDKVFNSINLCVRIVLKMHRDLDKLNNFFQKLYENNKTNFFTLLDVIYELRGNEDCNKSIINSLFIGNEYPFQIIEILVSTETNYFLITILAKWLNKYKLANKFPIEKIIKSLIKNGDNKNVRLAESWIEKYELENKFPIEKIIKLLIQNRNIKSVQLAESWIEKYKLRNKFSKENKFPIEEIIKLLIQNGDIKSVQLAESWIERYKLEDNFSMEKPIEKLIKNGGNRNIRLAESWIEKYQLQDKFPNITLKPKISLNTHNQSQNVTLKPKISLNTHNQSQIIIGNLVDCVITNIIPSRVFVIIESESRSTSIYIGELTNKRLTNIYDFKYRGEKLHIWQQLTAKVISIDEKGRINLSLKQVKQNEISQMVISNSSLNT